MADKNLLQLPLATTAAGALVYGIQNNIDVAIPANVLQGSEQPQGANLVYAGPPQAPGGFPTFRPLVQADIPDLSSLYLSSNGGSLVGATINNSTFIGGSISGSTAVFDDDKFTLRDQVDTTKQARFELNGIAAGTLRTFTFPDISTVIVGTTAQQDLTNKTLVTLAGTSARAPVRIPHGQAPSSPINGDVWTTNAGMYVQANNATIGPLAAAASSTVTTFNGRQGAVTLTTGDVTTALGYTPWNTATNLTTSSNINAGAITGTSFTDGTGNLRTAITTAQTAANTANTNAGNANTNANTRVLRSGDTMTGTLTAPNFTGASGVPGNPSFSAAAGTLGVQGVAYAVYQSSVRVWQIGVETDRSLKFWAYNDAGTFMGEGMTITRSGAVSSPGGFGPGSDPKLKDSSSLKSVDNALDKVYNLNVRYGKYNNWYNADGKERVFLMADKAMEDNVPQAIIEDLVERDGDTYKGWSTDQIIALLVKSVQELKDELDELKEKVNE